ncbi:fibronectin type III domain-containing protein [Flavobacterium sp. KMS]|uniref:fibronectin type III domain-containing protein n=1 Tax=Flavobacterium sp. KMS TaxID=1566023 RepID=UPI00068C8289|nr:fibronectin type III domain-containing protein [Flavobacterium sp. KMS]
MKQVNFSHSGGFPLEQETLERLQTAYRHELFEALKGHLSIKTNKNYIVAPAMIDKKGWAIIHQEEKDPKDETGAKILEGILYPIEKGTPTGFLKTTRTGTSLTYGTGVVQNAYFDYKAQYISPEDYANRPVPSPITDALAVYYYELKDFKTVKDLQAIETDIDLINQTYLPLDGSKAMKGDLDLGSYKLSKLDIKESATANVRVTDFRLGSTLGRAIVNSNTNLSLNYGSDWQNTNIGGKVYLENLNTSDSTSSLLVLDDSNQVIKNNTLIKSLVDRIVKLEEQPATTVPIGMIAIWGKTAPFPKGWEEYVPLRGRMPVGLDITQTEFNGLGYAAGQKRKQITVNELPEHSHTIKSDRNENNEGGEYAIGGGTVNDRTSSTEPAGAGHDFSILNPYRVVHFIEYTGTTAVTNPTNLEVSNIGNTTVTLSWTASTDSVAVANYLVSINGALPFSVGNVLSYDVTGLAAGTFYSFYVVAQDAAGKQLGVSKTVSATTTTTVIVIAPPTGLSCYVTDLHLMNLSWNSSTGNVSYYEIFKRESGETYGQTASHTNAGDTTTRSVLGRAKTTYFFKVRAIDTAGKKSDFTPEVSVTTEGEYSCFDVESLVTMASGQAKKLKNIVVGDKLQGFSFPNEIDESEGDYMLWNGKLNEAAKAEVTVVSKQTSVQPNYYEIITADIVIKVTGQHPLLVSQDGENVQYVCAKNLIQSMLLVDKTGKTKAIESILFKEEPLEVALLDVENVDNYVISGIVVHNSKPIDPKDPNAPGN